MQNWFKEWFNSKYYHHLYFDRDEEEAGKFMDKLLGYLNLRPGSKILDVACGKGRHAAHLAAKGFDVSGIDLSPESIAEASKWEGENLHFYVHDMRLPFWSKYFDATFNLFTSFGYFIAQHDNDSAMRMMANSIKENGVLVIDYLNAAHVVNNMVPEQTKQIDDVTYRITKWHDDTHFYKKIEIHDAVLSAPIDFTERVSKFTLSDFEKMLAKQGLRIKQVFGNYELQEYDTNNSPRMVIIAA